jgi:hypothetical protein
MPVAAALLDQKPPRPLLHRLHDATPDIEKSLADLTAEGYGQGVVAEEETYVMPDCTARNR